MSCCANGPRSTIRIGHVEVGRFIVGHNPLCGNSHISRELNEEMSAYFTDQSVVALYRRAEALGVRTFMIRGDYRMLHWVELYRRAGGTMNVVGQTASEMHDIFVNIRVMAAAGVEAIYHHGTQTDKFWREGRIDETLDYLKCMRDCGVAVGLGTHQPEVIDYAQQHGWDVDFYMACFYNISRVPRESAAVTGVIQYDEEIYLPEDREAMCRTIRGLEKPVLAFKVLAAGRNCSTQEDVKAAFAYAYTHIKPADAVVVGLFPKHIDQLALDLQYAEEACRAAAKEI
ncbi:MAG: hypothetical protein B1H04_00360 [Planctomycetales bacterium 4484_123]|nr:MAG: hypothetical protein B1H04_00360 [Planctomycetales bacterium 4484_123]